MKATTSVRRRSSSAAPKNCRRGTQDLVGLAQLFDLTLQLGDLGLLGRGQPRAGAARRPRACLTQLRSDSVPTSS